VKQQIVADDTDEKEPAAFFSICSFLAHTD